MLKIIIFVLVASFYSIAAYNQERFIANPASKYVQFMGYKSEIRIDSLGNQHKVCIFPNGCECDEWLFYRGICGKEYSYCAIRGCLIENFIDTISHSSYAVCFCMDSLGNEIKVPLLQFMEQHGDSLSSLSKKRKEVKN